MERCQHRVLFSGRGLDLFILRALFVETCQHERGKTYRCCHRLLDGKLGGSDHKQFAGGTAHAREGLPHICPVMYHDMPCQYIIIHCPDTSLAGRNPCGAGGRSLPKLIFCLSRSLSPSRHFRSSLPGFHFWFLPRNLDLVVSRYVNPWANWFRS